MSEIVRGYSGLGALGRMPGENPARCNRTSAPGGRASSLCGRLLSARRRLLRCSALACKEPLFLARHRGTCRRAHPLSHSFRSPPPFGPHVFMGGIGGASGNCTRALSQAHPNTNTGRDGGAGHLALIRRFLVPRALVERAVRASHLSCRRGGLTPRMVSWGHIWKLNLTGPQVLSPPIFVDDVV